MPARGPPLHQFSISPPLPEDHTDIFGDPAFRNHIYRNELVQRYARKHVREWLQEMYPSINLPLGVLPDPNTQPQYQFTNKIPSFTANLVTDDIIIQERTALDNLPPPRVLPDPNMQPQYQFTNKIPSFTANLVTDGIIIQERTALDNLSPPRVLPDPNMQLGGAYRLQFIMEIRNPTFTSDLVGDKNGSPIKVAIYDTSTQSIISADNFLSSAKVRIIVLDAEFWKNRVNWSRGEFDQNVLGGREGKGPILTGRSHIIQLQNGVGTFENIVINDNSSWTKSGFRLGVMVEGDGEEGYLNGERVQEGVSEPFRVKDRRGKASQKPKQLKLTHGVKCIKKIGKDRASLLQKKNINTVNDFLKSYYNDEAALREILGIKSESSKEWDSMIEHAMQCENEFHAKYNALNNSKPRQSLVRPMEGNLSLSTNGGSSVVGSGSSEPNPSENFEDLLLYGEPFYMSS